MAVGRTSRMRPAARRPAGSTGWSLLECLVGIGVAAIVAAATVPGLARSLASVRLRTASLAVAAALARGRAGALAEGRTWEFRIVASDAFEVAALGSSAAREKLPAGAEFGPATSGGTVRFTQSGTAENATIALRLAGQETSVVINQRGRVTLD
ncbi:MAG TPA: hypothetical protein VFD92_13405 [Candidatus Binatia bacterium]|nr:hypothetical protein [Candidatus Binatia bacterium]